MSVWARVGRYLAAIAAFGAYPLLAHYATIASDSHAILAVLSIAIFTFVVLGFAWRSTWRYTLLVAGGVLCALLWITWSNSLWQNVGWLYYVQHAGTNAVLGFIFGRTLFAQREPLCSHFASLVHGSLTPKAARYTRQVTVAWTLFFAFTVAISTLLFFFGPLAVWSTFANILYLPMLGVMFVGEYLIRLRVLPEEKHSPLDAIAAFRNAFGTPSRS